MIRQNIFWYWIPSPYLPVASGQLAARAPTDEVISENVKSVLSVVFILSLSA
jgi:hypothetical protein